MRREIDHLETVAKLLDSKFRIPGTTIRFGWDTVVGLIPVAGDATVLVPSGYILYKGFALGARKATLARMFLNICIDMVLGAIPVIGDLFDMVYKSNLRNIELLKKDVAVRNLASTPDFRGQAALS